MYLGEKDVGIGQGVGIVGTMDSSQSRYCGGGRRQIKTIDSFQKSQALLSYRIQFFLNGCDRVE
jgi:hypothetical protein